MNARGRRMIEMAITARAGAGTIYRSVSPWELDDILRSGKVTGRGAKFSGDWNRTKDGIWFGETIPEVEHHGRDWRRYLESSPEFSYGFRLKERLFTMAREVADEHDAPRKANTISQKIHALGEKLQAALFERLGKVLNTHKERYAYVLEITDVPGGDVYSQEHSLSGGKRRPGEDKWSPPEIKMPSGSVALKHIGAIHVVSKAPGEPYGDAKVTKTYSQPSGGWSASMFGPKGLKAPDVAKDLAAVRKLTDAAEQKVNKLMDALRQAKREEEQRRLKRERKQRIKQRASGNRSMWGDRWA